MPGTLYVVATPIGNLEDITLRALRVLREVAVIAAEDTRRTARLLQHYSISTPTTSVHEHNERARVPALLERLERGESVALVSDAGTPVLSDPGTLLVAAAHAAGVRVEPIPGPSAALAAVSASGLPAGEVLFLGFPPSRSGARRRWLTGLAHERRLLVLYEAPHRVRETLQDLLDVLGDRPTLVAREVSKMHESLVVQPLSAQLRNLHEARGEFTLVVAGAEGPEVAAPVPPPDSLAAEFGHMTQGGERARRDVIRDLARKYQLSTRDMYRLLESARRG